MEPVFHHFAAWHRLGLHWGSSSIMTIGHHVRPALQRVLKLDEIAEFLEVELSIAVGICSTAQQSGGQEKRM
jgi:hypothetical protein